MKINGILCVTDFLYSRQMLKWIELSILQLNNKEDDDEEKEEELKGERMKM